MRDRQRSSTSSPYTMSTLMPSDSSRWEITRISSRQAARSASQASRSGPATRCCSQAHSRFSPLSARHRNGERATGRGALRVRSLRDRPCPWTRASSRRKPSAIPRHRAALMSGASAGKRMSSRRWKVDGCRPRSNVRSRSRRKLRPIRWARSWSSRGDGISLPVRRSPNSDRKPRSLGMPTSPNRLAPSVSSRMARSASRNSAARAGLAASTSISTAKRWVAEPCTSAASI